MKKFAFICILLVLIGSTDNRLSAQNLSGSSERQRIEISENVLQYVKYDSKLLALTNATFYDGNGRPAKINQTIIIADGYFQAIGEYSEVAIPPHALVINLKGKTVIPGIVGVHNHLHIPQFPFVGETASKLYLASGITTIQTCGSASPQEEIDLANRIDEGQVVGPAIVSSGPYFTGTGGNPRMIIPRNEKHIRDTIQYWTKKGVRWFKVYRNTKPDDLKIIIDEAHKQNAKVTGHLCSITFEQAINYAIDGIEHGLNSASDFRKNKEFGLCNGSREYMDKIDISNDEVKRLHQLMIDKHVFLTSTLAIYEASIPQRAFADEKTLNAMSPYLVSQYQQTRKQYDLHVNNGLRESRLKRIMAFERQFFKMGGTLAAGVDAGRHVLPGFGDQRNFELLKEAGFSTSEVLKIMTSNGAKVLSNKEIGSIEVGKKADFIIIDGKIEDSIEEIELVFKDGYGYDPKLILRDVKGQFGVE